MGENIVIAGNTWTDVPSINIPKSGGGTAAFTDTSDATLSAASQLLNGITAYNGAGAKITGTLAFSTIYTGSSAPSSSLGVNGDIYLQV